MCGLVGVAGDACLLERLPEALRRMRHRGPNALREAEFTSDGFSVRMGFARLSIRDLSPVADQPLSRGTVTVLFNGEIYNADHLRGHLQALGRRFLTTGDSEVVTEAIRTWGFADAIARLEGMFAIAAYDHADGSVHLARDRFGIKPLYYHHSAERLLFASDITSLTCIDPALRRSIDHDVLTRKILLDPFIGFQPERTAFSPIQALAPGSVLTWRHGHHAKHRRYYDLLSAAQDGSGPQDLHELLRRTVREHIVSDAPLAFALSGGFDSSLLTTLAAELHENITAFTVDLGSDSMEYGEDGHYARLLAQSLVGLRGRHIVLDRLRPWTIDRIDRCVTTLGSPLYDERVRLWDEIYSTVAAHGIRVFINGQGADEMWYGYYPKIWNWFTNLYQEPHHRNSYRSYFDGRWSSSPLRGILRPEHEVRLPDLANEVFDDVEGGDPTGEPGRKLSLHLVRTCLGAILEFEDALSMRHSVEVRVPFVDHKVAETALRIRAAEHIGDGSTGKAVLKGAFADLLPRDVVRRQKAPLPKPRHDNGSLRRLYAQHLSELVEDGLVQSLYLPHELKRLLEPCEAGTFYANPGEAMLQILSTWRFNEVNRA
ncbi:asparagine synthase (glutamine-hydrolyzing) [Streptomyces sp. AC555_RSS877]|uniref:asparagine synthase (glutamine-hydrolyzing) n=1 Tax=Streptomyces sp. AC555_RSS877 TaxID=2823688 RepID=UPI001C253F5F|nr:asparagine synthase (glutamine-hydrolyzing) [Streptomyces sp. AC555_RSS877]